MTQEEKAIELFALYSIPSSVWKRLVEIYKEDALTLSSVSNLRKTAREAILKKRKELGSNVLLLEAEERWNYLQTIIDEALVGNPIISLKTGDIVGYKAERDIALKALALADNLAKVSGVVKSDEIDTEEMMRKIVLDLFNDYKAMPENKNKSIRAIIEELKNDSDLPETCNVFFSELLNQYGSAAE